MSVLFNFYLKDKCLLIGDRSIFLCVASTCWEKEEGNLTANQSHLWTHRSFAGQSWWLTAVLIDFLSPFPAVAHDIMKGLQQRHPDESLTVPWSFIKGMALTRDLFWKVGPYTHYSLTFMCTLSSIFEVLNMKPWDSLSCSTCPMSTSSCWELWTGQRWR